MCTFNLKADDGTWIVAKNLGGQNALYAGGEPEYHPVILEYQKVGGFDTDQPTRMELHTPGGEYVTLHGTAVVLYHQGAEDQRPFEIIWMGCDKIALKGANGYFVSRETEGNNKLEANREKIGPWEVFTLIPIPT